MADGLRYYVYVLRSMRNGKRYVGFTRLSPDRRLKQHNRGSNKWTKQNGPFELIYKEVFCESIEARRREKFLKSGVGRKELDRILNGDNTSASAKGGPASGGG